MTEQSRIPAEIASAKSWLVAICCVVPVLDGKLVQHLAGLAHGVLVYLRVEIGLGVTEKYRHRRLHAVRERRDFAMRQQLDRPRGHVEGNVGQAPFRCLRFATVRQDGRQDVERVAQPEPLRLQGNRQDVVRARIERGQL
ncbi:MAG: hypothetical protein ACREXX_22200, partial [Gammaproteobacteria bacterium]